VDLSYRRTPATFAAAMLIIVVWAITGPIFGFSNTWQLVINTGTTIITFLMVFLIQNTQTRDGTAVQLKLDELIRAIEGAHNGLLDLEELSDEDLERLRAHFEALARESREDLQRGLRDTELASCRPIEQALRDPRRLRRLLKQHSKSYVRTQRDDLEVEQTYLDYRECSDESLGFAHIVSLEDQHEPRAVVRP
jgi:low affinity Fe/Cu permease